MSKQGLVGSADWLADQMTEVQQVWDAHPDEEYRRDQSHWRGHGRWTEERWADLGLSIRRRLKDLRSLVGATLREGESLSILEWGSGGGANLVALAPYSAKLYAVEVSEKNLAETKRQLAGVDTPIFHPILATGNPADVAAKLEAPVDIFFSSAVFHVFPSKEYGSSVLRSAYAMMCPNAVGYIQIRYDDGNPKYLPKSIDQYPVMHQYAMSWGIAEFWGELEDAGFTPIKISNLNMSANLAAFYFRK